MSDMLRGIRVLDFTLAAVGPFCSRVLCDLGADVIHVEWPRQRFAFLADDRAAGSRFPVDRMDRDKQLFAHTNAGKKSLAVNLKTDEGLGIIRRLVAEVDVVVENMTPRVMQNFGLSYDALRTINPRIVMCSMSGFGQTGFAGDTGRPCTDPVAQGMSGMSWVTGERDGPPYAVGGAIGDTATAMMGVTAILASLIGRGRTGLGQYIDLSMVESLAYLDCTALPTVAMGKGEPPPFRNGQQGSYTFPMGPFKAAGGYVAIQAPGAGADSPWGRLCSLMGRPDVIDDPRLVDDLHRLDHVGEVIDLIEGWLCSLDDREVALVLLASERISSGPVLSQEEILVHPFFEERGTFGTVEYPLLGSVKMVQPPFKFSDADAFVRGPAPEMGEHTRQVMHDYLELDDSQIERLIDADVLFESKAVQALRRSSTES